MQSLINRYQSIIKPLIFTIIVINACGLLSPVLNSNDAYFYAVISKTIANSNNWIGLYYGGQDWLDKPHFPFWMAALSFKILGINSFAYVLPGFLFHLLGAYYTYRLGKHLYNEEIGLIAVLIYVSSLHLMLSAMDVRAEAYLLGEIMPACYYWLIYDKDSNFKSLLLASFFTGLAMMTKGLFVVVTIFSGIVFAWLYTGQIKKIISPKWLLAYGLSLVFILPELICLYLQFDAHPEKVIFGQTHVSGLAWYFWGSQFGRFFNSGPIVNKHGNPFFFVHTYLWAFLPWSMVFIVSTYQMIKRFRREIDKIIKAKQIYLLSSFWLTFIMFSATKFQLDHYTNIIMPFAAILCADYIYRAGGKKLAGFQTGISILLAVLTIGLTLYLFKLSMESISIILSLGLLVYIIKTIGTKSYQEQIIIYPALAIGFAFIFIMLVNGRIYEKYDVGYNVAHFANNNPDTPITVYKVNGVINNLAFHANNLVDEIDDPAKLSALHQTFLLVGPDEQLPLSFHEQVIGEYDGLPMEKFIPSLFSLRAYNNNLQKTRLIYLP